MSGPIPKGLLSGQRRLHFIGVGGAGMSGIAELCLRLNIAVSGCDLHSTRVTQRLASLGRANQHGTSSRPYLDRS